jgi:hypothetical protein
MFDRKTQTVNYLLGCLIKESGRAALRERTIIRNAVDRIFSIYFLDYSPQSIARRKHQMLRILEEMEEELADLKASKNQKSTIAA